MKLPAIRFSQQYCFVRVLAISFCFFSSSFGEEKNTDGLSKNHPEVIAYLNRYCTACHGAELQQADRRFDELGELLRTHESSSTVLREILDVLNRGEMPPADEDVKQPSRLETEQVVNYLTQELKRIAQIAIPKSTVMRRLNRYEYVNTMRDLLGLRPGFFSMTSDFPVDALREGFDNNGEALILSEIQLRRYLEVASMSIEAASYFGAEQPKSKSWVYSGNDFNGVDQYESAPVTWRLFVDDQSIEIGHGQPVERHPNFVNDFVKQGGVPADGWYTIGVEAAAMDRILHGYEHEEFNRFRDQPLKLSLWVAPNIELLSKNAADQRQLIKVWDLADQTPQWMSVRVWLNKGAVPFLSWTNGISSKGNIRRVAEKHHPEVIRPTKTQIDAASLGNREMQAIVKKLDKNRENPLLSEVYHGPRVRIGKFSITGPMYDRWPPVSHQLLYGNETEPSHLKIAETLLRFATRAFRRPVKLSEIQHYVDHVEEQVAKGRARDDAVKQGLAAILISPRFLFLDEGNDQKPGDLNSHELAARLSYFLWGSMPDKALMLAANNDTILNQEVLREHALRMINHQKSNDFVQHFADTWLGISNLGSMPPDPRAFESYYRDRLEKHFKTETYLFLSELMMNNQSVIHMLDCDYTFLNGELAAHYGIHGVYGEDFKKVRLDSDDRRGGLLGHGSILTLTANGIETSPVVRGVWILEKILGTPPAPPPPDVDPIEPDIRGSVTIVEQLKKHRSVATCEACHRKIDPLGFALEFFDPVGAYRSHYSGSANSKWLIDGSGRLPTGETFQDERGMKSALLAKKHLFVETLTEKLATYAAGRSMGFADRQELLEIAAASEREGFGFRDLIVRVITSDIFRSR